jgi:outer membrane protein assembly factor BamB
VLKVNYFLGNLSMKTNIEIILRHNNYRFFRLKIVFFSFLSSLNVSAQNWSVSTGGNALRNGASTEYGPSTETLLWSGGESSTIARSPVSDSIYLVAVRISNTSDVLNGSRIVMMDIRNGDTLWTTNLPVDFLNSDSRNRISAIRNGVVYASRSGNSNASYLYALDAANGSVIWKSESLIDESATEGLNFLENGDLIVGNSNSVMRINKVDGTTVWQTDRLAYGDGAELAVFDSKIYGVINDLTELKVAAYDAITGQLLYKSAAIDNGLVQQQALFMGNDGTVYLPRSQNNSITDSLYSFTDNGSGFTQNWSVPIHYIPFSSSAIGLDGSVYSYSRSGKVIRIDPITGSTTDSSQVILYGNASYPRMSIDAAGIVNVTNGGFSDGAFFSFNADLTLRWQTTITNVYIGGPLIGWDGILVICGVGNDIRAYQGDLQASINDDLTEKGIIVYPTVVGEELNIGITPKLVGTNYWITDGMGKMVLYGKLLSENTVIDFSSMPGGAYLLKLLMNEGRVYRIVKQ